MAPVPLRVRRAALRLPVTEEAMAIEDGGAVVRRGGAPAAPTPAPTLADRRADPAARRGRRGQGARRRPWKRASKVHVAQGSEASTGQAREWVTRHFSLKPSQHSLVYKQNASDPDACVRGIVPLASYERVEATSGPHEHLPYAFRLCARGDAANPEASFVFAASSEEERNRWIGILAEALPAAAEAMEAAAVPRAAAAPRWQWTTPPWVSQRWPSPTAPLTSPSCRREGGRVPRSAAGAAGRTHDGAAGDACSRAEVPSGRAGPPRMYHVAF